MKKICVIILFATQCLCAINLKAQNVTIPDPNFKAALLANTSLNRVDDGEISFAEAEAYTRTLQVSGRSITDLTGIEAFINLSALFCNNNSLTSLDISSNLALTNLSAIGNSLTSIDVSNNVSLRFITLSFNALSAIDVSNNLDLVALSISNNQLTSIDVSANTSLQRLNVALNPLASIDLSQNTDLRELDLSGTNVEFNPSSNPGIESLALRGVGLSRFDPSLMTELTLLDLSGNSLGVLDISNNEKLVQLRVSSTRLSTLDVSNNPNLEEISANDNLLTHLDVSNNNNLIRLNLLRNNLEVLDLTGNSLLTNLLISSNAIKDLDLSNNPNLTRISAADNELIRLDLRNGSNTIISDDNFETRQNLLLPCISVNDVTYAENTWSFVDPAVIFSTDCDALNTAIFDFSISGQTDPADIDYRVRRIQVEVPFRADLTSLIPSIELATSSTTVVPASGVPTDFTNQVTFTVTSADGSASQNWFVTVNKAPPSTAAEILSFTLPQQIGGTIINSSNSPDNSTISVTVPFSTDLTMLEPSITLSNGATIDLDAPQNFTNPIALTVTAEDGLATKIWIVTLEKAPPNTDTDIVSFELASQTNNAIIDNTDHTVAIEVRRRTDLSSLEPMITLSQGATVNPEGVVDFTEPFTYTVTAEDGTTSQVVKVCGAFNP